MAVEVEHHVGFALLQQAETAGDFLIGLGVPAEVAAEPVLVELLVGGHVPEPAAVGADLVGEDDPAELILPEPAELELEIDQADSDAGEQATEEIVHPDRHVGDVVHLFLAGPAEGGDMLVGDHRIAERVVLVIIFDDRARQLGAFLDAEALRKGSGGDVAHHHLDRNDLDLADELLAHVQPADEVGRDPDRPEQGEDMLGNAVVEHALAGDRPLLLRVEGRRIVLEILNQRPRFRTLVEDLGLAFVDHAAAGHCWSSG